MLKPLGDRVVIKMLEKEETTKKWNNISRKRTRKITNCNSIGGRTRRRRRWKEKRNVCKKRR